MVEYVPGIYLKKKKNHHETAFKVEKRGSRRGETGSHFDSELRECPGWNLMVKYLVAFLPINFGQFCELDHFITNKSLFCEFWHSFKDKNQLQHSVIFQNRKENEGRYKHILVF